ncbi:MAG TPA: PAS domain-containing protein [Caulobacteraceae bacterium]|nr:PAS domain-containing protein [Caulobacteraceae bacterium]
MFHSNTELLIDYWRTRKENASAPLRAAINPAEFPTLLPQVFILGRRRPGDYHFRLVGGLIEDLHGGSLNGMDPLRLWSGEHHTALQLALEALRRTSEPLVIDAEAGAPLGGLRLEVLLAPMRDATGAPDRVLGLYQPLSSVAALMGQKISTLFMRSIATGDAARADFPRLRLAAADGRRLA